MKISTKGRYGIRAMLELALHYSDSPIMVKDIARRQSISERYLEQLLLLLKVAGFVKASRGTHGGFILSRPPSEIKLNTIINALEGPISLVDCVDAPDLYPKASYCAMHDIWLEVGKAMDEVLESITLKELAERQVKKEARAGVLLQKATV
jgi:Rrf2 family transcriptional regulator, cysteine metabolism repressor